MKLEGETTGLIGRKTTSRSVMVALVCLVLFLILTRLASQLEEFKSFPVGVMDTECELTVVTGGIKRAGRARRMLADAERALRDVEVQMSSHLSSSEVSVLNASPVGQLLELSEETIKLLKLSRSLTEATNGAFDVTCKPIIDAWVAAGKHGKCPTDDELAQATAAAGWQSIELLDGGARKLTEGAAVDLGGIAKGYAIDQAVEALINEGALGGLVNVGGDVRCFGMRCVAGKWLVAIQNPFNESMLATIGLSDAAVCTSGNYRRFETIDGKRYSHIIDPRTSRPAEMTPSVTVVAPTATIADAWATALSVLGTDGLALLPSDGSVHAIIIVGTEEGYEMIVTAGIKPLWVEAPTVEVRQYSRVTTTGPAESALVPKEQ